MISSLAKKLNQSPKKPGCYLWKNKNGKVIYIGKAKNIFNRLHQYFSNKTDYKTKLLVNEIHDVEYIILNNDNEALITEQNLIKKYLPKYNILLKETDGYPYIVVTKEKHPRIIYTRRNDLNGKYYGPFASTDFKKYELYKLLQQIFPLRKCWHIPKKTCLYYHLDQCLAPCINNIEQSSYDVITKQIDDLFKGKNKQIISSFVKKEKEAAQALDYETANRYKNLITTIQNLDIDQNVQLTSRQDIDFIGFSSQNNVLSIMVFSYIKGKLLTKNESIYTYQGNLIENIISWLCQYYSNNKNKPKKVFVSLPKKHIKELSSILDINFIKPVIGEKLKTINVVINNAHQYLLNNRLYHEAKANNKLIVIESLKNILKSNQISDIVAFDGSNLFGQNPIAAMIHIQDGEFIKSKYRLYKMKNEASANDFDIFKETISRFVKSNVKNMPDVIMLDGGKSQMSATIEAMNQFSLNKKPLLLGLVKNKNHKTDHLLFEGKKIVIDKKSPLFLFLQSIQDEVHRFTINFFRKVNEDKTFRNELNDIQDLGKSKVKMLTDRYENASNISKAPVSELAQIVSKKVATKIKKRFK